MRNRFILTFAFSVFFLVLGTGGLLGQVSGEPDQNPASNMGALKAQIETAGSYSAHSGNATRAITDLSVPGALGDYGLDLVRYWNSLRNDRIEANSTYEPDQRTDFGSPGWSHSWGWVAYYAEDSPVVEDGQEEIYITSITITFPDGHASKYKITRSNRRHPPATGWNPDPRCGAPFWAAHGEDDWTGPGGGVGDHLQNMTEDGSSFWLYRADGGSVHFEVLHGNNWDDYRATEVYDPHGLRTALTYDADGYLYEVIQDGGRKLTFRWDDYDDPSLNRYWPKVIGKVTSSTGSAGTQAVSYGYNWNTWLTLTSVTYENDPAPGYTSKAVYTYGDYTPPEGFVYGGPLLLTAKDPRFAGPMQYIRYDYALSGCRPQGRPQTEPYQGAKHDYYYASPTGIAAERDGKTGAYVSRFGIGCFDGTRTEYNGFNGLRKFFYGHSAMWTGSGAHGYELAKVTDYTNTYPLPTGLPSRRQSYLNGHPRQSWDGRGIPTEFTHTDGTGFPSEIKHVGSDNSTYRYDRANPGNSQPRDTTRVPNPGQRWLFSKTDERNQTTTYTRDGRRRVTRIDHPDGSYETFDYDTTQPQSFNLVTSHRLASGAIVTYQYDGRGLLLREWNNVEGYEARKEYLYDSLDRVFTMQDGFARQNNRAFSTRTTYNGRHQPLTVEYAATGSSTPMVRYEYDSWGNRTATIDELAHRKDFVYDGYGRCKYASEAVGPGDCGTVQPRQTDWIYDRVIELGPNSQATFGATSHTSSEWRIQIEPAFNAAGHRRATARTFDINNRMVSEQTGLIQLPGSPLGTLQAGPDTETRRFTYDENGQKKTFTDPRNRVTTYEYDQRNRVKKTIEPLNRITETSYDTTGNKTLVKFPDNTTRQWLYYDAFGQPRQVIDERNNTTYLNYWGWGPMKKLSQVITRRTKDNGQLEDQQTSFWPDGLGRPSTTGFPDGSSEQTTYIFGQPKTFKTRRDQKKIINGYDARGRETHHYWVDAQGQIDPRTPAIDRNWDDASRMTRISNIYSIIDYTYDQAGQVRTEGTTVTGGGPVREVRYCRYPNGEVSQITYPNGSTVVNRFYTARGQLSSVGWGSGSTSYVYLPDGKVDYQPFTNGVTTRYGYDGRGMIQSISHKNGAGQNLAYREYWRDDRDRILAWKRGVGGPNPMENGRGDRYRYDAEGQLEMADYRALYPDSTTPQDPMRRDVFHYDQLGNRMGSANVIASWGPGLVNFTRENNGLNQYISWTRGPINYDDDMGSYWGSPGHANGVTMQEGWITASYNALKQPKAIWSPSFPNGPSGAQFMWFGFDPLGRCVKRWMGPDTGNAPGSNPATYYYYDGWSLIQEGPGGSTADRTYVHGGGMDEIVASQAGGEWVYHHYDARGHCIMLTKASDGTIREQYDYDAFGYPYFHSASGGKLASAFQFGNRFLFTGREWLKDLRVYDYRNRIYQPELGRFLQPDPTGFEGGDYNLYRYCHNDPVNKTDPDGNRGTDYQRHDLGDGETWRFGKQRARLIFRFPEGPSGGCAGGRHPEGVQP